MISTDARRKVAIVTGASSGIGYAVTRELAKHNYQVYACARRLEPIEPLVSQFSSSLVKPYKLDISDPEQIVQFKGFLKENLPDGKLDLLYNNAGQSCTFPALDVTNDTMEQAFKVNVFGHINMCRELSQFIINAKGTIVFTGSAAGIVTFPFGSVYSATKAAIHAYARGLHLEMKPFGVRVINVITGAVATNIADKRPLPDTSLFNFKEAQEAVKERQEIAKRNHPVSADEYARQIVNDIVSQKDPVDVYRGTLSTFLRLVSLLVPYWLLEWGMIRKFHLQKPFAVLEKKYKGGNDPKKSD